MKNIWPSSVSQNRRKVSCRLRLSSSKHFLFYCTKKHFISELYFTKNHEIGSLVLRKAKKSWDLRQNRELGPAWESKTFRHVCRLDESKKLQKFINVCLKVGHSDSIVLIYKHSKSTWIVLWLFWNVKNQHIAERERPTTVVVLISGALVWRRLIYERCVTHLHKAVSTDNLFLALRVIHKLTRPWSSRNQRTLFIKLFRRFWCYHVLSIAPVRYN